MTTEEKILYVADYIEPERPFVSRKFIERLAFENLDKAVFAIVSETVTYLKNRGKTVHPYSEECLEFYLKLIPDQERLYILGQMSDLEEKVSHD